MVPNALQLYDACVRPGRSFTVWEVSLGITAPIVPKCVSPVFKIIHFLN